jgi:hypothetical protein
MYQKVSCYYCDIEERWTLSGTPYNWCAVHEIPCLKTCGKCKLVDFHRGQAQLKPLLVELKTREEIEKFQIEREERERQQRQWIRTHRNEVCASCDTAIDYYDWYAYCGLCPRCFMESDEDVDNSLGVEGRSSRND